VTLCGHEMCNFIADGGHAALCPPYAATLQWACQSPVMLSRVGKGAKRRAHHDACNWPFNRGNAQYIAQVKL
jgi:hypothetical protein